MRKAISLLASAVILLILSQQAMAYSFSAAQFSNGTATGNSAGQFANGVIGNSGGLQANILNPGGSGGQIQMYNLNHTQSFSGSLTSPGGQEIMSILIHPTSTGDLNPVYVSENTGTGSNFTYNYTIPFAVSGICSNGLISCTPGTWTDCAYYEWTADSSDNVSLQEVPYTDLGGCYCINNSCGYELASANLSIILQDLGGGAIGAMMKAGTYNITISDVQTDSANIVYYGQMTQNATPNPQNYQAPDQSQYEWEAGSTTPQSFYGGGTNGGAILAAAGNEQDTEQSNPNSLYNLVANSEATQKNPVQQVTCNINQVFEVTKQENYQTIPFVNGQTCVSTGGYQDEYCLTFQNDEMQFDDTGGSGNWISMSGGISESWEWVGIPFTVGISNNAFYFPTACYQGSTCINGTCFQGNGTAPFSGGDSGLVLEDCGYSNSNTGAATNYYFDIQVQNGEVRLNAILNGTGAWEPVWPPPGTVFYGNWTPFPSCPSGWTMVGNTCVQDYDVIATSVPTQDVSVTSPDVLQSVPLDDQCQAYENNSNCQLKDEWVDGVQTWNDYASTGLQPMGQVCKQVCGWTCHTICYNWWTKERIYTCTTQGYDFSQIKQRANTIVTSTDNNASSSVMSGSTLGDINYTDYNAQTGAYSNNSINVPFGGSTNGCMNVCKVEVPVQDTQADNDVNTSQYRSTNSYMFDYRKCTQDSSGNYTVCPYNSANGETVITPCQCIDEFAEAASIIQTMENAGQDITCSNGVPQ